MVASTPVPSCVADIDEHNLTDHAALLGTLRGWEDELESYIEEEQPEQEEGQELLPRAEGHRHLEGPMEEQGVRGPTQGGPTPTTTLDSMSTEDVPMAQGLDEEQIMKDLGWTLYLYSANPAMPKILFIDKSEDKSTQICRWVRYSLIGQNPYVEGTMGYDKSLYCRDLHAEPRPGPTFNDNHTFRDNHLQIFKLTHKSRGVVDQTLEEMGDVRLAAEVQRFRYWSGARQIQRQQLQHIEAALRDTDTEHLTASHYLARARGPSHIGTTLFTLPALNIPPKPRTMRSPSLLPIPPIKAAQGPNTGPDPPSTHKIHFFKDEDCDPQVCYYCLVCMEPSNHTNCNCRNCCKWCLEAHPASNCPKPHAICHPKNCHIPISHPNHGEHCPQYVDNPLVVLLTTTTTTMLDHPYLSNLSDANDSCGE
jgi:hypothetical protein